MTIPAGYGQVNHFFDGNGLPTGAQVTLGFRIDGTPGDPSAAAEFLHGLWEDEVMSFLSDEIAIAKTLVKYGPDNTGPSGEFVHSTSGGDGSDSGYPGASALARKITADGGRAGRGRMFVPGIPEAAIASSGALDSGKQVQIQDALNSYATLMAVGGLTPVVLHQPGAPISTPSEILTFAVQPQVATQRRRNRR